MNIDWWLSVESESEVTMCGSRHVFQTCVFER